MAERPFRDGLALLKDPNVARLFAAYLISYTGNAMAPIAMAFGVLRLTGSPADASFVIAAPTVAAIVMLMIGGAIGDRVSRRKVIYRADLLAMCTQLGNAWLFISGYASVPALAGLMLLNGVAAAFQQPAKMGLIVELVEPKHLQAANALLGTARNGAVTGGAALGGVLVAAFGAGPTLLVDALTFAASAALVFTLNPRLALNRAQTVSLLADIREGWRVFTSHTWLWVIVAQFSLVVAASDAVFGLLGPAVSRTHMNGAVDWGFIVAGLGVGTFAGGLAALRLMPAHPMRAATICVFFFAGVPLALAVPTAPWMVMLAAFIGGVAGQLFSVLWYTTLQRKIAADMLSRVSAYDHLGSICLAPLGIVAGGFLYEALGFRPTLIIAALTIIVPTALALLVRDVRMMTADPGDVTIRT